MIENFESVNNEKFFKVLAEKKMLKALTIVQVNYLTLWIVNYRQLIKSLFSELRILS
jgi:hypothetical protein